jgi:hypothetical protein
VVLAKLGLFVLLAGCGRIGFDEHDDGTDAHARFLTTSGGPTMIQDVALTDAGELLLVGGFSGTLTIAGRTVTAQATMTDLFVVAVEADGNGRWLWGAGCSEFCDSQGVFWLGDGAVSGAYFGGLLANGFCDSQGVVWLGDGAVSGAYFGGLLANGGALTSGSGQDALVMWFGPAGQVAAANQFGATGNVQIRALDGRGSSIAITGLYADTVDFGRGALASTGTTDNGFIAVFDTATRAVRFDRAFSGAGDVYGNDIAIAPDGSMCVTGRFMATTDFGGGLVTPTSGDAFVARYDAQGNFVWARTSGGPSNESGLYVTALDNGDCVAAGHYEGALTWDGHALDFAGGEDTFVARFNAGDGAIQWLHTFTGTGRERPFGIASHGNDRIAVGAGFVGTVRLIDREVTSVGTNDAFLLFLDGTGNPIAVRQIGGTGTVNPAGGGMAYDPSGTHLAAGFSYANEVDVLGFTATTASEAGAVLVISAP